MIARPEASEQLDRPSILRTKSDKHHTVFRVLGLGFRVWGLGFEVEGFFSLLRLRVWGLGFGVQGGKSDKGFGGGLRV